MNQLGSAEETSSDLMAKCSPGKPGARHPISGYASSRPAGARAAARPPRPEAWSADPPAATGTEPAKAARHKPLEADVSPAPSVVRQTSIDLGCPLAPCSVLRDDRGVVWRAPADGIRLHSRVLAALSDDEDAAEAASRDEARRQGIELPFETLSARFGLTTFERLAVLLCIAAELDAGYGRLFAFILDDSARRASHSGSASVVAPVAPIFYRHAMIRLANQST